MSALAMSAPRSSAAFKKETKTVETELSESIKAETKKNIEEAAPTKPVVDKSATKGAVAQDLVEQKPEAQETATEEQIQDEVADLAAMVNHTYTSASNETEGHSESANEEGTATADVAASDDSEEETDSKKLRKRRFKKEAKEVKETGSNKADEKDAKQSRSRKKASKESASKDSAEESKVQEGTSEVSNAEDVNSKVINSEAANADTTSAEATVAAVAIAEPATVEISYSQLARVEELCLDFAEKNKNIFEVTPKLLRTFKLSESEKVYTGYDSSILANGKSGFVITEKGIYCKMPLKKNQFIPWSDYSKCSDVKFKNDFEGVIYVGELPVAYIMTMSNGPEKNNLYELFVILLNTLRAPEATS